MVIACPACSAGGSRCGGRVMPPVPDSPAGVVEGTCVDETTCWGEYIAKPGLLCFDAGACITRCVGVRDDEAGRKGVRFCLPEE